MIDKIDTNNFRLATNEEKEKIVKYITLVNKGNFKITKVMMIIFLLISLLGLFGIITDFSKNNLIFESIFLMLFLLFLRGYLKYKKEENCKFNILVQDCTVYKIETNPDTPGYVNVRLKNKNDEVYKSWFRARYENLEIGSKCLLVYVEQGKDKHFRCFSEFMLTEEGLKYRI